MPDAAQSYSAHEIASILVGTGEYEIALERIKYWTRKGLLVAAVQNPGTGNHRKYAAEQLDIATVLYHLDELGIALPSAKKLAFAKSINSSRTLMKSLVVLRSALDKVGPDSRCRPAFSRSTNERLS